MNFFCHAIFRIPLDLRRPHPRIESILRSGLNCQRHTSLIGSNKGALKGAFIIRNHQGVGRPFLEKIDHIDLRLRCSCAS